MNLIQSAIEAVKLQKNRLLFARIARTLESAFEADALAREVLESTALRATFWTVMDYGCSMALRVVNSLVLTRLLMPESFGLMALVATLVVGISLMSDIGLGPSVIRSPRGDDSVLLEYCLDLAGASGSRHFPGGPIVTWPMALIYHEPRLMVLVAGTGPNVLIGSFNSTNLAFDVAAHAACADCSCSTPAHRFSEC
jgi:hypothetical protein